MAKKVKSPVKLGRPTKYLESMVEDCYKFFDKPLYDKKDNPNMLPTVEGFACSLRVHKDTIYEWAKKHPAFSDSLSYGRQKTKEFLNHHSLLGNYHAGYAKFFAINATDMVEKKEVEHKVSSITIDIDDDGI